ncbi:MAG: hypothetical protein QMC40_09405 [Vicingaceae bacterium]
MPENLKNDLKDAQYNRGMNKRPMLGNKMEPKYLLEQTPFHESLRLHYSYLFGGTHKTTNVSDFYNLKSTGFNFIRNNQKRRNITSLYSDNTHFTQSIN